MSTQQIEKSVRRHIPMLILAGALLLLSVSWATARAEDGTAKPQSEGNSPAISKISWSDGSVSDDFPDIAPTDRLIVTIKDLDTKNEKVDPSSFRLRLGGYRFGDVLPDRIGEERLSFDLAAMHKDPNWSRLIQAPPLLGVRRGLSVGIATSGADLPFADGAPRSVDLQIFSAIRLFIGAVIAVAIVLLISTLGAWTGMLRDSAPVPSDKQRPYSLARCQMAFWLTLITIVFTEITLITGDYNNIVTPQSLVLLGLSSATGLTSIGVDQVKAAKSNASKNVPVHTSLWEDLLTDDGGWALHRVQILIWTMILGVVSLWSAWDSLRLPDFDSNLLILMGISSVIYLGFKAPEVQTDAPIQGTATNVKHA